MKITVKTVKQQQAQYEIDDDATVLQLKQQIAEQTNNEVGLVNLVCAGKQLKDGDKLTQAGVKDGSVVILFIRKAAAKPAATQPQPVRPAATTPSAPATQPAQATPAQPAQPALDSASVTQLVNMGYPKDQAEAALRAAFGDVSRAVEYLTNGIPDSVADLAAAPSAPAAPVQPSQPSQQTPSSSLGEEREIDPAIFDNMTPEQLRAHAQSSSYAGSAGIAGLPLAPTQGGAAAGAGARAGAGDVPPQLQQFFNQLRTAPQFEQIRQLVRTSPQAEEMVLQQFASSVPQIAPLIATYRTQILDALRGGAPRSGTKLLPDDLFNGRLPEIARQFGVTLRDTPGPNTPLGNAFGGDVQLRRESDGSISIALSPEDRANIQSIISITNASPNEVIQTYLACGKDVTQTINLLMDK